MNTSTQQERQYAVILRGTSAPVFTPDKPMRLRGFPCAYGGVDVVFRTHYVEEGFEAPVPRELWVAVRGPAPSLDAAVEAFASTATGLTIMLAVSANAPVGSLDVHVAFDSTSTKTEHEFLQNYLPERAGQPRPARRASIDATIELLKAVMASDESERVGRGAGQYHAALANWQPGREAVALAHLYMAAEALTKALLRKECQKTGLDEEQLASCWGISDRAKMEGEARLRLVFSGDSECHRTAGQARHGFQHAFLAFDEIRRLARDVRHQTASYVRSAMIGLANVEEPARSALLEPPFDTPLDLSPHMKSIRCHLVGDIEDLPRSGQEYPAFGWESKVKSSCLKENGDYDIVFEEKFTPLLGDGIQFRDASFQVRGSRPDPRR